VASLFVFERFYIRLLIRKILPGEERVFAELGNKCWKTAYRGIISDEYIAYRAEEQFEERVERFAKTFKNPHYEMFFAEYDGELKRMNFEEVIIWVLEENRRARRFYERNGFALDGGKKEIEYGEPMTCLRYVKGEK
jgi:hypothetical protein